VHGLTIEPNAAVGVAFFTIRLQDPVKVLSVTGTPWVKERGPNHTLEVASEGDQEFVVRVADGRGSAPDLGFTIEVRDFTDIAKEL
jgi:hypothetical protein